MGTVAIEVRFEMVPKCFKESNASQKKNPRNQLHQERQDVADEAHQLPHGTPALLEP